jgi:hypothetical protein
MSRLLPLSLAIGLTLAGAASAYTNDHGIDAKNFDTKAAACTDFYRHANGGWLDSNPIPAEYSNWGMGNELRERNLNLLKQILEDNAKSKSAAGTNAQKIGDFYASAMDEAAIEKAGAAPIKADLAAIDRAKSTADILALLRRWHATVMQPLFGFGGLGDLKNSSMTIAYATQGFHANAVYGRTGERFLNKGNSSIAGAYHTIDAGVGYRWENWDLRVDGYNMSDSRAPVAESEIGDAQFYRLPGRSYLATVTVDW